MEGADLDAIRQLVLAGFPTTNTYGEKENIEHKCSVIDWFIKVKMQEKTKPTKGPIMAKLVKNVNTTKHKTLSILMQKLQFFKKVL